MSTRDLLGEARGYAAAYLEDVVNRHVGGTVDLLRGLGQTVVASIGPTTSEEIARRVFVLISRPRTRRWACSCARRRNAVAI
jgi:hypothetical protein